MIMEEKEKTKKTYLTSAKIKALKYEEIKVYFENHEEYKELIKALVLAKKKCENLTDLVPTKENFAFCRFQVIDQVYEARIVPNGVGTFYVVKNEILSNGKNVAHYELIGVSEDVSGWKVLFNKIIKSRPKTGIKMVGGNRYDLF